MVMVWCVGGVKSSCQVLLLQPVCHVDLGFGDTREVAMCGWFLFFVVHSDLFIVLALVNFSTGCDFLLAKPHFEVTSFLASSSSSLTSQGCRV